MSKNRLLHLHAKRNGSFIPGAPQVHILEQRGEAFRILQEGEAFHRKGDTVRARLCYREVIKRTQNKQGSAVVLRAMFLLALVCYQARIYDEAVLLMDWVRKQPKGWENPDVHYNLGMIFHASGRTDDAMECYRTCLAIKPDYAAAETHMGNLFRERGDLEAAEICYQRVLSRDVTDPNARYNLAFVPLMRGDLARGFELYEARLQCEGYMAEYGRSEIVGPTWSLDSRARSVLVWNEQGNGDTIQFARFLPKLVERGLTVTCEIPRESLALFKPFEGPHLRFIPLREKFVDYDAHVALLSLPAIFGVTLDTIPPPFPIKPLAASPIDVRRHARGPVIGLAWAGNPNHHNDRRRSAPILQLLPLLLESGPDITWVALQTGGHSTDTHRVLPYVTRELAQRGARVIDASGALHDFARTAALIPQLDLLITVDTAVAHLAGTLGTPVWLMPPVKGEWRWLEDRDTSPWYPSMRIFRHGPDDQWLPLAKRIADTFRTERAA